MVYLRDLFVVQFGCFVWCSGKEREEKDEVLARTQILNDPNLSSLATVDSIVFNTTQHIMLTSSQTPDGKKVKPMHKLLRMT